MMEKRKKDKADDETRFLKKKSKALIAGCGSSKGLPPKSKYFMEESKESFSSKPATRKSVSSGKRQKENLGRSGSSISFHPKTPLNTRYLTEALPSKASKDQKKLVKSSMISPERYTFQDVFSRSAKDRLSLNDAKKQGNPESGKGTSTECEQLTLNELADARKGIQNAIKRTCQKESISKKDFLKITSQYEKLITRIVFSEVVGLENKQEEFFPEENEQSLTFRVEAAPKGKQACPGLHLQKIKALKIDDYQDEFMSHYDELSESWKRDIAVQRRY